MTREVFDDDCAGCRPAMIDPATGARYADDSPPMVIVNRLWSQTSLAERRAWHRFTCQNSRAVADLQLVKVFSDRIQAAFDAAREEKTE